MRCSITFLLVLVLAVTACTGISVRVNTTVETALYSGPGNLYFDELAVLPAGTSVAIAGGFGDFLKVTASLDGRDISGYILSSAIDALPAKLKMLQADEVPFPNYFMASCASDGYDAATDTATFTAGSHEYTFTPESLPWALSSPVRLRMESMSVEAGGGLVTLFGRSTSQESGDLFYLGVKELAIATYGYNYVLTLWGGSSATPVDSIDTGIPATSWIEIAFDDAAGTGFTYRGEGVDEHVDLLAYPDFAEPQGLFPYGEFTFGMLVNQGGTVRVQGLRIGTEPDGVFDENTPTEPGLAYLAAHGNPQIGTYFEIKKAIDRRYCSTLLRDFKMVLPFVDTQIWTGPDEYDFHAMDRYIDFAAAHGLELMGAVNWGAPDSIPGWLNSDTTLTRDDYIALLQGYTTALMSRYADSIDLWEVVNEVPERVFNYVTLANTQGQLHVTYHDTSSNPYMRDFWYEKIGLDYVKMSYDWARELDPAAEIMFNTSVQILPVNQEMENLQAYTYYLVSDLMEQGVTFDTIGFQAHLGAPTASQAMPDHDQILAFFQQYVDLGLKVSITEMDYDLGSLNGTQEENYNLQAQVYREHLDACKDTGACSLFMTWGFTDALSYVTCSQSWFYCFNEPDGAPLLYDKQFIPKPAYFALYSSLSGVVSPVYPAATPEPLTAGLMVDCAKGAVNGLGDVDTASFYDDFEAVSAGQTFDSSKWQFIQSPGNPLALQVNGVLVIANDYDELYKDTVIKARNASLTAGKELDLQADLAICELTTSGDISVNVRSLNLSAGLWVAGCDVERYDGQYTLGCGDLLQSGNTAVAYTYRTSRVDIEPGEFHRIGIKIETDTLKVTYTLDGDVIDSHTVSINDQSVAGQLQQQTYYVTLSTWKTSPNSPLMGLVDNVVIDIH